MLHSITAGDFRSLVPIVHWRIVGVVALALLSAVINFCLARRSKRVREALALKAKQEKQAKEGKGGVMSFLRGSSKKSELL
mmetsp:Transcript_5292/g.13996  ORF Transcript_5292/g.13996 Transcript_5292/m.13996 type:complete len:81 (+) Transcript_5292:2-244(+)